MSSTRDRDRGGLLWPSSARTPGVHRHRAAADRLRRDQLELPRSRQAALVQRRAVAGNPGVDEELVASIRSSRSSSVASLPLPRSTPAGVASLSFGTPARRSPARWWLLVHGKSVRVDDTTYFGLASSLTAHSRIARGASSSPRATAGQ